MEPGQRAAPGHRQARPRRPRLHADHVRRLRVAAACRLDRHPRPRRRAGAAEPGQRVGVRAAHRRRAQRLRADRTSPGTPTLDLAAVRDGVRRADRPGRRGARRARASPASSTSSCAPPTCATSGRPTRCGCRCPDGPRRPTALGRRRSPTRFHDEHRALYGYDFRDDPRQQVEWVNLRVTGVGPITPARARASSPPGDGDRDRRRDRRRGRSASTRSRVRRHAGLLARPTSRAGDVVDGPGDRRGVRLDGAAAPRLHRRASTASATSSSPRSAHEHAGLPTATVRHR